MNLEELKKLAEALERNDELHYYTTKVMVRKEDDAYIEVDNNPHTADCGIEDIYIEGEDLAPIIAYAAAHKLRWRLWASTSLEEGESLKLVISLSRF